MTPNRVSGHVEFADDMALQAIEDATSAVAEAETAARHETTCGEVLDHMSMHLTRSDNAIFTRALRQKDRQDIAMMLDLIQRSFKALLAEKKSAILARKQEPRDDLDDGIR